MRLASRAASGAVGLLLLLSLCATSLAQDLSALHKLPKDESRSLSATTARDLTEVFETIDKYWKTWSLQQKASNGSKNCSAGWSHFWNTKGGDGAPLALKAIDATGKLSAGILEGNFYAYGSYDECFAIGSVQYCIVPLYLVILEGGTVVTALPVNLGLCSPAECNNSDISRGVKEINSIIYPQTQGRVAFVINNKTDITCSTQRHPPYNTGAIIMIGVCSLFAALAVAGTIVHWLISTDWQQLYVLENKENRPHSINSDVEKSNLTEKTPLLEQPVQPNKPSSRNCSAYGYLDFITAFSLFKTIPTILSTKQPPSAITSLNGIRVISMFWVILGHTHLWVLIAETDNILYILHDVVPRFTFQPIINGFFSVDSFFFLSGLLVAYLTLRQMDRKNGRFPAVMYYLHRFLRLTPTYAFIIFFSWLLTLHIGDGPIYNSVSGEGSAWYQNCEKYWWTNLLYINNFYPWEEGKECIGWTWYLANDMQFYIIAPLMIVFLYHSLPVGLAIAGGFMSASFIITGALAGVYEWPVNQFTPASKGDTSHNQSDYLYIKPWARIVPYIVGILVGYLLFKKVKFPFNKLINWIIAAALWALAVFFCMSTVYGFYGTFHGHTFTAGENVLYFMFSRLAWGLGLAIVVFTCHNGYGWVVNSFLSMKIWVPLSRLTFTAYLIHPLILTVMFGTRRSPIHYTDITMAIYAVAAVVLSYGAAGALATFVEFPLSNVEAALFKKLGFGSRESTRQVTQAETDTQNTGGS